VRAARYPFHKPAQGIEEGLRGNGGQSFASSIWGVSGDQYLQMAEPWPLNPKGEILLGLKIEDRHALANAEASTKVPGIGFAEWGPGDMGMSLGFPSNHDEPFPQSMQDARTRVLAACKAAKIAFLNTVRPDDVEMRIKEGVMIGAGNQEAAEKGRRYSKRQMPW
jgi:4-hydroxy-2-oxoheptanedioate aldolase